MDVAKIVLVTMGSLGDLHPFLAIGVALKRIGHTPIIATHDVHGDAVRAAGIAFSPMRPSADDVFEATGLQMGGLVERAAKDPWFLLRDVYLPFTPAIYEDVSALTKDAALIVAHNWVFGAIIAAEANRIPLVRVALSPLFLQSARRPSVTGGAPYLYQPRTSLGVGYNRLVRNAVRRQLRDKMEPAYALRRSLGLDDRAYDFVFDFGHDDPAERVLGIYSSALAELEPDHAAKAVLCGFPRLDSGPAQMPPGLQDFLHDGSPPVVFTLGSFVVNAAEDFYRNGLAACRTLGRRSILIAGADEAERLASLAGDDTFICSYAPHGQIFAYAGAIVHHGGIGTTGEALLSGKPQLVVPFLGDQPDNARRLVELGVARRLMAARKFGAQRCTVERLTAELHTLLSEATYSRAGAALAARIAAEQGAAMAAQELDRLIAGTNAAQAQPSPALAA
jgi:UDP:flavonoid glycosyltransferase YjiC (YdhE family)